MATAAAYTKLSATASGLNPATAPAVAVRTSTSAVASLSRLSPSSTVTTREVTPTLRTIATATASVGLRTAPSAIAQGKERSGISHVSMKPSATEVTTTSRTDRAPIFRNSRRKSMVGMETEAE